MSEPTNTTAVDLTTAARFLDLMAEGEAVTFQTFDDDAGRKSPALANVLHGFLESHAARLKVFNDRGAGVFWTVGFTDGAGRKAENVTAVRAVFLDLDGAPLEPVLAAGVEPHAVVESSPGKWHVYWLVNGCKLEEFKLVQQALAAKFNGDPSVNDLPRVMRLPGFLHRKGEPFATRVESMAPMQPYEFNDLVQRLGLDLTAQKRTPRGRVDPETGEISDKVAAGGRHAHIVRTVGVLNTKGLSRASIAVAAHAENTAVCDPPLDGSEVDRIVTDLLRRYADQHAQAPLPRFKAPPADDAGEATPTWPDPIIPGLRPPPEIPADLLPGWVGDMAAAVAAHTQTPQALAVMTALAVLATTVQRRFVVAPLGDAYREPLPLWTLIGLPSGTRKTAVFDAMKDPMTRWEKLMRDRLRVDIAKVNARRAVARKRIEKLTQDAAKADDVGTRRGIEGEIEREELEMPAELHAPRLYTTNCTPEQLQQLLVTHRERMAVMSDEPDQFMIMSGVYSGGNGMLDVYLQGHAGSPFRVDRGSRLAHVDMPALSLALAVQPDIMAEVAGSNRFRGSGLLARLLFAMPASNVGQRDVRLNVPVPQAVRDEYHRQIDRLLIGWDDELKAPEVLTLSPEARELWLDLAERIERAQGEGGKLASISDWSSKAPGAAARIAAVLALAEFGLDVREVPLQSMARAVRLIELLIPHARAAFTLLGTDHVDADAAALLKWIRAKGELEFTRHAAHKGNESRFRNVDKLKAALERLEAQDVVRGHDKRNRGARASVVYAVNPKVLA